MDWQIVLPYLWLIPLLPALGCILIAAAVYSRPRLAALTALAALGSAFLLSAAAAAAVVSGGISMETPFIRTVNWFQVGSLSVNWGVLLDPLSALLLIVVSTVALLVAVYSVGYMRGDAGFSRFFCYICLFAAAMLGLVLAANLLQLFVLWELVGLCSYLLIGYYFFKHSAVEAAKKAFMTTRIGDFGLLLGILLLQTALGTLDFPQLTARLPVFLTAGGSGWITVAAVLVFCGPLAKSGQFPLHVWLPDAMEGPTPVSALIHAATMVVAGVYLIARCYMLFAAVPAVLALIAWCGAFTALFAAVIALTQREIKRILAYSTISQLGYMMLALGVGSLSASMFHLMTHAFFKALLFLGAGAVMHALQDTADIFQTGGLRKTMPFTHLSMGIAVLAIAGIPPFAGFFSKDEILAAAAAASLPLYAIAALTAVLTAFYMGRMFFSVFYGSPVHGQQPHEAGGWMLTPLLLLAVLSVAGGIVPFYLGFGEWVRFGPPQHAAIDWQIAGVSTLLSLAALGAAWRMYGSGQWPAGAVAAKLPLLYRLSRRAFYIDECYAWSRRVFIDGLGRILYWIDIRIIDGLVDNLARSVAAASALFRRLQTGQVQHYILVYFAAAVALVACLGGAR
ncbi:MAG: NADH-quinone oxidoreductase subunit L [Sporomusaceae bacterium]|nr:NADH-quinone oxidoreductase subunit L [Sporomusaceae bacterium]